MSDYKETSVSGNSWQRCNQIVIRNPLGAAPSMTFEEEVITILGDRTISERPKANNPMNYGPTGIGCVFEPAATFPLINPLTGEPTGDMMDQQTLYVILYSLYMQKAVVRDEQVAQHEAHVAMMMQPAPAPEPGMP